jgi:hypothetical protein
LIRSGARWRGDDGDGDEQPAHDGRALAGILVGRMTNDCAL